MGVAPGAAAAGARYVLRSCTRGKVATFHAHSRPAGQVLPRTLAAPAAAPCICSLFPCLAHTRFFPQTPCNPPGMQRAVLWEKMPGAPRQSLPVYEEKPKYGHRRGSESGCWKPLLAAMVCSALLAWVMLSYDEIGASTASAPLHLRGLPAQGLAPELIERDAQILTDILEKQLTPEEQTEKDLGYERNAFNQFVSDRLSLVCHCVIRQLAARVLDCIPAASESECERDGRRACEPAPCLRRCSGARAPAQGRAQLPHMCLQESVEA
jgi:hypothetical protein